MYFTHKPKKIVNMSILAEAKPAKSNENEQEVIPQFHPVAASMKQTITLFTKIFNNMLIKSKTSQHSGMLLAGDPGTGKTTRIGLLSKVLGLDLISVEAPHIIEEHIINIPFIHIDSHTGKKENGTTEVKGNKFSVVLADSNLYSKIKNTSKISDEEHIKALYKGDKNVIELYEALGGTPFEMPELIKEVRNKYSVILFLDEYFRQTSARIRNILRGILDGKIGAHDIPRDTFIIYATNFGDEGVEGIQKNQQFNKVTLSAPTKQEWFSWLTYKYKQDKLAPLNPSLINRFHHILEDEHLSYNDTASAVRTSPRRWEQLLIYINASLTFKNEEERKKFSEDDAKSLLTNVKTNFRNYKTGKHSELVTKVLEAVSALIKEETGLEISSSAMNSSTKWRETLHHQIKQKMKLGDRRSYVPVIAGLPGIGKTAQASKIAHDENLRFIDINCSLLNPEDTIGLPLADTTNADKGNIETTFSLPSLYQHIMERIKAKDKEYLEELKKEKPDEFEELKKEYNAQPFKYLIFFDELNRVASVKVFNALRRILLEKNFGPAEGNKKGKMLELPKEALVMGAINPHDKGTLDFTGHFKDVLDIIHSTSDWKSTISYIEEHKLSGIDDNVNNLSIDLIKEFADKFKSTKDDVEPGQREFYLNIGKDVYISPREYTSLYYTLSQAVETQMKALRKLDIQEMSKEEIDKAENDMKETVFEAFKDSLDFIFEKHSTDSKDFLDDIEHWIYDQTDINFVKILFFKQAFDVKTHKLESIIGDQLDGTGEKDIHKNPQFVNYMEHIDLGPFVEDLSDLLVDRIKNEDDLNHYINEIHPAINFDFSSKNNFTMIYSNEEKTGLLNNFFRKVLLALALTNSSLEKIKGVTTAFNRASSRFHAKIKDEVGQDIAENLWMELQSVNHDPLLQNFEKQIIKMVQD